MAAFHHLMMLIDEKSPSRFSNSVRLLKVIGWSAIAFIKVPFLRPASLSDDFTVTVSVIQHAITKYLDIGWSFDFVCCIYPCVPLLQVTDLQRSFQIFLDSDAKFCYPVVEFESAIQRALLMDNNG